MTLSTLRAINQISCMLAWAFRRKLHGIVVWDGEYDETWLVDGIGGRS